MTKHRAKTQPNKVSKQTQQTQTPQNNQPIKNPKQ